MYLTGLALLKRQFHQENNGITPNFDRQYIALTPRSTSPHTDDMDEVVFQAGKDKFTDMPGEEQAEFKVPLLTASRTL